MRFEEAYTGWQEGRLTQVEAARLLGVCERTLRRQIDRYEIDGMDGLIDKRLAQLSHKRAPVDEVMGLVDLYRSDYPSWNAKHFHIWYVRDHGGQRSYTWVKSQLQQAGAVLRAKARGKHRKKRDREPLPGMMVASDSWLPCRCGCRTTIARLLKPIRAKVAHKWLSSTKPGTLLKKHIPIQTGVWDVALPGTRERMA